MNSSKNLKVRRAMAIMAMLVGSMFATSAYGQECDPSWYNPWAGSDTAAVHSTQKQAGAAKHQQKVKTVSETQRAAKAHVKRTASQNRPS